ncbi:MAG: hypothetical protein AAF517_23160 [Planctomycetota bacterium]
MSRPMRGGWRTWIGVLVVISGLCISSGCSARRPYSPAEAARAKVNFLRREGARLNPYQVSLIHQVPYSGNARTDDARMRRILLDGAANPDQPSGYRREKLGLRAKAESSLEEGTPENSREDTDQ